MRRAVYKYELLDVRRSDPRDVFELELPGGANPIAVAFQGDTLCMWAIVTPDSEKVRRTFLVYGTGVELTNEMIHYIGTAHYHAVRLVLHVFELEPNPYGGARHVDESGAS